jgi:hypothetical protein
MNNQFESWEELYEWMAQLKPISYRGIFLYKPDFENRYINQHGRHLELSQHLSEYQKHIEPEKPKQWYQVIFKADDRDRPYIAEPCFVSKEDFLEYFDVSESEYEWIKLIPVRFEE